MPRGTATVVILLLMSVAACGGSHPSPTAPSSPSAPATPPGPAPSTFHVTGIVTEDDGHPVAGATITILNRSVTGTTDGNGFYSLDFEATPALTGGGLTGWVRAQSADHDTSYNYLVAAPGHQDISRNLHVYRITRITAGESTVVTVLPGDSSCGDNDDYQCRTVHVVAPADGVITMEAVPTPAVANPVLALLGPGIAYPSNCCSLAASTGVAAGTELVMNVGIYWTSTVSQTFVFKTYFVRP